MVHDLVQLGQTRRQRFFPVLIKKELRVSQPRAHHALVAADHRTGVGRTDIRHHQKPVGQPGCFIQQRKIFLVYLHGQNQAFLRHRQERGIELPEQHIGPLNQRGYLVQQRIIINRLQTLLCSHGSKLARNLGAALGKAGDDRALLTQLLRVAICR